jgi:hypothetical protein
MHEARPPLSFFSATCRIPGLPFVVVDGALNAEMEAAGARFFAGGLQSARYAKSLRKRPDGEVMITDGPYAETKEHIGGFWILEAADMEEALAWGRKAVVACRVPVEVREFVRSNKRKKKTGTMAIKSFALVVVLCSGHQAMALLH